MVKAKQNKKKRHIPERTCVACRTQRSKQELVRIVYTSSGDVKIDETGKQNGRGAYLCKQRSCWETALKRGALSKALRAPLSPEARATIHTYAATLPLTLENVESYSTDSGDSERKKEANYGK